MPIASLRVLGPFSLVVDGRQVARLPRKVEALLTLLAIEGRPLVREMVADMLWRRSGLAQQQQSLRQAMFVVSKRAGSGLVRGDGILLALQREHLEIDAVEFVAGAAAADRATLEHCAGLYRGELLETIVSVSPGFDEWLMRERARFAETAAGTLRRLAEAHAAAGAFDAAIAAARRMLALDELREDAHRLVIGMLAAARRRSEALRHFDACAERLERELGVAPEPETLALVRRIRSGDAPPAFPAREAPPPPVPAASLSRQPERRMLTVLACSIDGLSALAEQGDPEDVREATTALRAVCDSVIMRCGGVSLRVS